jgi:phosphoribosylamine--glycine ligase
MKIAILGSGGREHALTFSISKSNKVKKIYCIPGNAGTSEIAENISIDLNNFKILYSFIKQNNIDLVVVGPEEPLVNGIVDYLEKLNVKVFGPNKFSSQLEGSKIFTKNLCKKYNIPTAEFGVFKSAEESYHYIDNAKHPLVIKADNLAAGKGVYICKTKSESYLAVKEIFDGKFGIAKNILFEEFLEGEEMSYFIVSDGKTFRYFGSAQDHKRVGESDKGKNTGGMGAYSPSRLFNKKLEKKILDKIIKPTLEGIKSLGTKYKGFLYAGLMIVKGEPFLIEYNVRMGDPECQTILPTLKTDIVKIFQSCIDEKLNEIDIRWSEKKSLCVVLCSIGYPEKYEKNIVINNFEKLKLDENNYLFHAGTIKNDNKICSFGGRVLNFISLSENYIDARRNIHKNLESLNWNNGFYRKDIGYRVIDK